MNALKGGRIEVGTMSDEVTTLCDAINQRPHIKVINGLYVCVGFWFIAGSWGINSVGEGHNPKSAYSAWRQKIMSAYDTCLGMTSFDYNRDYAA